MYVKTGAELLFLLKCCLEHVKVEPNIRNLTNVDWVFKDLTAAGENSEDIMKVVGNLDLLNIDDLLNYKGNKNNVQRSVWSLFVSC